MSSKTVANHNAKDTLGRPFCIRPYKRHFTFLEKCVIITSINNFQKLFLYKICNETIGDLYEKAYHYRF